MADEEAPGNGGGVQLEGQHQRAVDVVDGPQAGEGDGGSGRVNSVGPNDLQNIRLVIDIGDDRTVEIPLKGKLILQNSGPPQAAAAAGDAAPGNARRRESAQDAEDKEVLDKTRGWLMTVGALFVTMAFQAAMQPPDWLRTADSLWHSQSERDKWNHRCHGASHAAVAPARFAPSPTPSPQAAESAPPTAWLYMLCNYITFGSSLGLVLMLMFKQQPHHAKLIMWVAKLVLVEISLCVVGTVVLGTSQDSYYIGSVPFAIVAIGSVPFALALYMTIVIAIVKCIERFRERPAERTSAP